MYLIQDSKDILYIVISFCILWLTIFIAWFIYYMVMMAKQFYQVVKEMREWIKKIDETIDSIKKRVEHSASYLSLIGDGVKKLVDVAKEHGVTASKPKKKTKKK